MVGDCGRFDGKCALVLASPKGLGKRFPLGGNETAGRRTISDVARLLAAVDHGDAVAAGQLLPLVYRELRQLAAKRWCAYARAWLHAEISKATD